MIIKAGTRIQAETILETIEGSIARDIENLDGLIPVLLDAGYATEPGEVLNLRGYSMDIEVRADGSIYASA